MGRTGLQIDSDLSSKANFVVENAGMAASRDVGNLSRACQDILAANDRGTRTY